jgi:type III secretion protein L
MNGFIQFKTGAQDVSVTRPDPSAWVLQAQDVAVWHQAQAVLAQAHEQSQLIRTQAEQFYESEKARGYAEGLEQVELEQIDRMIDVAGKTVDYFAGMEQRVVKLVMQSVRRVIDDFSDEERVMAVVRSGLAVMRNQKQLTLRLSSEHVDSVRARANELLERFPGVGMLDIVADPRLKGDAAILESDIGVVQASIDKQLEALENSFQKILGSRM